MGIRKTPIPSLNSSSGLATTPEEKAKLFTETFFPEPGLIPLQGEPQPPSRDSPPITTEEFMRALRPTSNKLAMGISGIGYLPIKWAADQFVEELITLFNECKVLGYHPRAWHMAKVVMLHKPNKKDPSTPRSYRPITLEEMLGKCLEKIIANHLQFFSNEGGTLPHNQFGARWKSGVNDAAFSLTVEVEATWNADLYILVLAVDIQGFFDQVHHQVFHTELQSIGCPEDII
ncbi:hypothetical protein EW145_g5865 [Phellinidium pouzarii]|uniref:Reverse transcriptase domain-containing protein n=1 Tax=Phellinidium pouzarii TaxID=167371 RepID=A0A4S4KZ24_9AGAM|nr:hypothetical protein EW145_g5865 [Phellinidium pouzarii]